MKNTNKTILVINNQTKIIMFHRIEYYELNCCSEDSIMLIDNDVQTMIADGFIYDHAAKLGSLLKKALLGLLTLDKDIKKNLGYLFNEYSADICEEKKEKSIDLVYIEKNNKKYWPGNDYSLWADEFHIVDIQQTRWINYF